MKSIWIILLMVLILSCSGPNKPKIITPCELPIQYTTYEPDPVSVSYGANSLSPDCSYLYFMENGTDNMKFINLKTNEIFNLNISSFSTKNIQFKGGDYEVYWCPYDNTKFVTICVANVDTIGDGKNYIYGYHLIEFSIDGSFCIDISPKILGSIGAKDMMYINEWMPNSMKGNDQIIIYYESDGINFYGIYNPDSQLLQSQQLPTIHAIVYSNDRKYYFYSIDSANLHHNFIYYINNNQLALKDSKYVHFGDENFSPDGTKLAFAANVIDSAVRMDSNRLAEVWIVDIPKFMQNPVNPCPYQIINVKQKLCMFSDELDPVFTSNNTLAVSMYHTGDIISNLYEIDLNGNMIRQLTFGP